MCRPILTSVGIAHLHTVHAFNRCGPKLLPAIDINHILYYGALELGPWLHRLQSCSAEL